MGRQHKKLGRRTSGSDEPKPQARHVVVPNAMGHLLDADVPTSDIRKRCAGKMVTLPCGVQLAFDGDGRYLRGRAPRTFSLASCPRITLDEAAAALDELDERLQALEGMVLANDGEGVDRSVSSERPAVVRTEIRDEVAQRFMVDGAHATTDDAGESVGGVDEQ